MFNNSNNNNNNNNNRVFQIKEILHKQFNINFLLKIRLVMILECIIGRKIQKFNKHKKV